MPHDFARQKIINRFGVWLIHINIYTKKLYTHTPQENRELLADVKEMCRNYFVKSMIFYTHVVRGTFNRVQLFRWYIIHKVMKFIHYLNSKISYRYREWVRWDGANPGLGSPSGWLLRFEVGVQVEARPSPGRSRLTTRLAAHNTPRCSSLPSSFHQTLPSSSLPVHVPKIPIYVELNLFATN